MNNEFHSLRGSLWESNPIAYPRSRDIADNDPCVSSVRLAQLPWEMLLDSLGHGGPDWCGVNIGRASRSKPLLTIIFCARNGVTMQSASHIWGTPPSKQLQTINLQSAFTSIDAAPETRALA
jgi:hypothetical protein